MTGTPSFKCYECFDTGTIDSGGREIGCPNCNSDKTTVRLTGFGWGLGLTGARYATAVDFGRTFIEFYGTRDEILRDVSAVSRTDVVKAKMAGRRGRNSISSGALAIERRVRKALER